MTYGKASQTSDYELCSVLDAGSLEDAHRQIEKLRFAINSIGKDAADAMRLAMSQELQIERLTRERDAAALDARLMRLVLEQLSAERALADNAIDALRLALGEAACPDCYSRHEGVHSRTCSTGIVLATHKRMRAER